MQPQSWHLHSRCPFDCAALVCHWDLDHGVLHFKLVRPCAGGRGSQVRYKPSSPSAVSRSSLPTQCCGAVRTNVTDSGGGVSHALPDYEDSALPRATVRLPSYRGIRVHKMQLEGSSTDLLVDPIPLRQTLSLVLASLTSLPVRVAWSRRPLHVCWRSCSFLVSHTTPIALAFGIGWSRALGEHDPP